MPPTGNSPAGGATSSSPRTTARPPDRSERMPGRDQQDTDGGPIALLASAIPQCASLSVAVHVLHVVPSPPHAELAQQLLDTIDDNATAALHLCHRALELDGRAHDYTADEWLPAVYHIAAPLLEGARLHREPPSVVEHAQDAVRWLSQRDHQPRPGRTGRPSGNRGRPRAPASAMRVRRRRAQPRRRPAPVAPSARHP